VTEALQKAIAAINRKYRSTVIMRASEAVFASGTRVPFGVPVVDVATGGGMPKGRVAILRGDLSAGKSYLAQRLVRSFQERCRYCNGLLPTAHPGVTAHAERCSCSSPEPNRCVYCDVEGTFHPGWAQHLGLDLDAMLLVQPGYAEQGIDVVDHLLREGGVDLVVVDSIAALTPSIEVEASAEQWQMGLHARLVNKFMRLLTSALNSLGQTEQKPAILLINQVRRTMNQWHPTAMPGGLGQEYTSSITVDMERKGRLKVLPDGTVSEKAGDKDAEPVGVFIRFEVVKNKTFPPYESGEFVIYNRNHDAYGCRVGETNEAEQVAAIAVRAGIVERSGGWYRYGDKQFHGEFKLTEALRSDRALCAEVYQAAFDALVRRRI
jgi:recombination protein RecA